MCWVFRGKEFGEVGVQQNELVTLVILLGSYFIAEDIARQIDPSRSLKVGKDEEQ